MVACLLTAYPLASGAVEKDGLRLSVQVAKTVYTPGEPIVVEFAWTNVADRNLAIRNWPGPLRGRETLDSEGRKDFAVYFDGTDRIEYRGPMIDSIYGDLDLKPGQTLKREYEVSQVYDFRREGKYVIRAAYLSCQRGSAGWCGLLVHPDVILWVRTTR